MQTAVADRVDSDSDRKESKTPQAPFGCFCNKWQPYTLFTHHERCPFGPGWVAHIEALKKQQFGFRLTHLPSMTVSETSLYGRMERTSLRVEIPDLAASVVGSSAKVAAVLMCLERVVNLFGPKSRRVDELLSELQPDEQNLLREMLQLQASLNKILQA